MEHKFYKLPYENVVSQNVDVKQLLNTTDAL